MAAAYFIRKNPKGICTVQYNKQVRKCESTVTIQFLFLYHVELNRNSASNRHRMQGIWIDLEWENSNKKKSHLPKWILSFESRSVAFSFHILSISATISQLRNVTHPPRLFQTDSVFGSSKHFRGLHEQPASFQALLGLQHVSLYSKLVLARFPLDITVHSGCPSDGDARLMPRSHASDWSVTMCQTKSSLSHLLSFASFFKTPSFRLFIRWICAVKNPKD